ncbi:PIN domain-containing protein [Cyanobium sp. CH-040]|uniref:PIN domain-containing protein n=1 Tax=Cyanobium sp. CH-040 TaxID=2823708 RepID=UPI0020CC94D9|nr:PIN domain-containing protein [Cyanobium sp. CH-040]
MLLLDTNLWIDVLRGETVALRWPADQLRPSISVIPWIEVLVGCRPGEQNRVEPWLDAFPRLNLDQTIAREAVRLRQRHGLRVPDAIILATARCAELTLAIRNVRDFPLELGGVTHPYSLTPPPGRAGGGRGRATAGG